MGLLKNIGDAGTNPSLADYITPVRKPEKERTFGDDLYVAKGEAKGILIPRK